MKRIIRKRRRLRVRSATPMPPPKARDTTHELCVRAYHGAPGFPRWTKPLTLTVGTLERIDAAITIEDLYVTVPMHLVVTLGDREIARSEPVEVVGLGRTTHDILTLLDVTLPEPGHYRFDLCAKAKVVKTQMVRIEGA